MRTAIRYFKCKGGKRMIITDYRVQSVLRTYSKQLQRSKLPDKPSEGERKPSAEKVTISEEARRRLIMERMTSQVLGNAYPKKDGGTGDDGPVE
jgi:hypothetical protein